MNVIKCCIADDLGVLLVYGTKLESDPFSELRANIPGSPGVDYPVLSTIQETSFSCSGLQFGGYYADPEQQCQAYHVCLQDNVGLYPVAFLCPNGTIFNQDTVVCDWW